MTSAGLHDRRGLPLSTRSPLAVERYDEGVELIQSGNLGGGEKLREALVADEGFALAHAALALVHQLDGDIAAARESAAHGVALAPGTTRREQQHARAVAAAVGGDAPGALGLMREHLAEFPRDALLLGQSSQLQNFSGRADRTVAQLAFLESLAPAYGDDWYFLGALSFFHHELDHFAESRRLSERSLALYARNGFATHNLAHIFYETSDSTAGRAFLDDWMIDYPSGAPVHCHLSWHQALFELLAGRTSRVLELYARAINPTLVKARSLLSDSASLLWRLQIYGEADRPLPWPDVRDVAARTTPTPRSPTPGRATPPPWARSSRGSRRWRRAATISRPRSRCRWSGGSMPLGRARTRTRWRTSSRSCPR
jgi:hypothetical protein